MACPPPFEGENGIQCRALLRTGFGQIFYVELFLWEEDAKRISSFPFPTQATAGGHPSWLTAPNAPREQACKSHRVGHSFFFWCGVFWVLLSLCRRWRPNRKTIQKPTTKEIFSKIHITIMHLFIYLLFCSHMTKIAFFPGCKLTNLTMKVAFRRIKIRITRSSYSEKTKWGKEYTKK